MRSFEVDKFENKWMRAVIPALVIHCSIGTVYCCSLLKVDSASYVEKPVDEVEWAFVLVFLVLVSLPHLAGNFFEKIFLSSSWFPAFFLFEVWEAQIFFFIKNYLIVI